MGEYSYIITNAGLAKMAAHQADPETNPAVNITHIAVGDADGTYYTPVATQTELVNETKRVIVNNRGIDSINTAKMFFIGSIPASDYGYAIRETGLFDSTGTLIAVRKYPLIDKITEGNLIEVFLKEELIVANTSDFTITVDPSVIVANQAWVTNEMSGHNIDPDAHTDLFAGKSDTDHLHDDRYYTETEINDIIDNIFPMAKPCCISSGNTDSSTGLPDIVHKESDTEVSFKVGGIYVPLAIHDSKGKKYIISSIANVTLPTDLGTYKFLIDFMNLTLLEDGTYSAIATAVKMAYSANEASPTMTSNSGQGFTCWMCNFQSGTPYADIGVTTAYYLMDRNTGTSVTFPEGTNPTYGFVVRSDIGAIAINKVQVEGPGNFGLGGNSIVSIFGSNNGTSWTSLGSVPSNGITEIANTTNYLYYYFQPNINLVGGYSQYNTWLNNINFWYPVSYAGGNITEGQILPTSPANGDYNTLINQIPYICEKRIDAAWQAGRDYALVGEANRATNNGTLGIPRSYAFNRKAYKKISCPATNTYTDIIHNLGTDNIKITANLVCITTDLGYAVGQKAQFMVYSSDRNMVPFAIKDKNTICLVNGNGNLLVPSLSTGYYAQITPAKWNIELTVEANW